MRRIGIMGGTFDPIHRGHLILGKQAYEEYGLSQVWYMPSRQPPHKIDRRIATTHERREMVELAIEKIPYFVFSDFELRRAGGNTYTADTLLLLRQSFLDTEFFFIVGADSIFDIEKWYHPEIVLKNAIFLAANRKGRRRERSLDEQIEYLKHKYEARIFKLHTERIDISSQIIRERIAKNEPVAEFLPEPVADYIEERHLYREVSQQLQLNHR